MELCIYLYVYYYISAFLINSHSFVCTYYPIKHAENPSSASDWIVNMNGRMIINSIVPPNVGTIVLPDDRSSQNHDD